MATDKAFVLKHKLCGLVNIILNGDDYIEHTADEAITTLSALKELKCTTSLDHLPVTPQFRCPISVNIMTDPVILCTGQDWKMERIEVEGKEEGTSEHKDHLNSLLLNLTSSDSDKKQAAKEIRLLTKQQPSIRALFGNSDLIQQLLKPLSVDPEVYEDLITTLLHLSIHDDNKKLLGENERVISILIDSLKPGTGATIQTRSNAAAAISCLSAIDSNKLIIGRAGAIRYLFQLLEVKNPSAMKYAANAIFNLCIAHENKDKTIRQGAVQAILYKIMNQVLVDELLSILALFSSHLMAVQILCNHGAVPFLLGIMKDDGMSERSKKSCFAIIYRIFKGDSTKRKEIRDDEIANHTLSKLGTSRAKRKASTILHKLNSPSSSKTAT